MFTAITMLTMMTVSCGKKQGDGIFGPANVLKRVPKDAASVAVINMGQLMNKINYDEFKKTDLFKRILQETDSDMMKQILENPDKSGIATNGQFCMYVDLKGENDMIIGVLLPVKSIKDLEAMFEKLSKEKDSPFKKIEDKKDFKYISSEEKDNKIGLGWDSKMLAFVISTSSDPLEALTAIHDTKRKESIVTNKSFKAEKADGHDMMIWVQSDPIVKVAKADKSVSRTLKQITVLGLTEEALNGNTATLYYDFNKGEMESGISYKMNEQIEKEYGIIFKNKIETDFSALFPKKNLTGITVLGLDMKGVQQVLKNRGADGLADMSLSNFGLTTDEIVKGFKGELAVASYVDPNETDAIKAQKVVIAIAFEKGNLPDKLINAISDMGMGEIKKSGDRYMSPLSKEVQGILKNNIFVISNDIAILDKIESGGFKDNEAIAKKYYDDMKKGWMTVHVDYNQLFASLEDMPAGLMGSPDLSRMMKILNQYNELVAATFVSTTEETKFIVSLKNKDLNSLRVLSNTLNKLYSNREKIEKEMENMESSDSDNDM